MRGTMLDQRPAARVIAVSASDGSIFANVRYTTDDGYTLEIGCVDEDAAERLADSLNDAAWSTMQTVPA